MPEGHLIVSRVMGQVLRAAAAGIHFVDFPIAVAVCLKDNLCPVWRPAWIPIVCRVIGQVGPGFVREIDDVNLRGAILIHAVGDA